MKNWKTTLIGILTAISTVVLAMQMDGDVKKIVGCVIALLLALLGYHSSDAVKQDN